MKPIRVLVLALGVGLTACGGAMSPAAAPEPEPQLPDADVSVVPVQDPGSRLPTDWKRGPFAEIYVRGYKDSDGDGIGDLQGLTQQLDYLKDLGITGIWLMPVTSSQDKDHGYAVTDYRAIEPQYGSLTDFDELLRQAHARGIGVIIDYVMNHSAAQNPLFLNSRAGSSSRRRDWYVWSPSKPVGWSIYGKDPWYPASEGYYFAGFWDQMPDFNLRNPAVIAYHESGLRFWLNRGVDGFRFDAVGNLVENGPNAWEMQQENYRIMGGIRALVDGYANRYLVCEVPADPLGFTAPSACGSAFAFGHNYEIMKAVKGDGSAVAKVATYFTTSPASLATMVSNHDHFAGERLWDQVAGDIAQYRLAAATYLLQPGVPFIYYGEEIGMAGGAGLTGDWKLRTPMSWTGDGTTAGFTVGRPFRAVSANVGTHNVRAQLGDPNSLHAFYRALIGLRHKHTSLLRGSYDGAVVSGATISFKRNSGNETSLIAINYGGTPSRVAFSGLPGGTTVMPVYPLGGTAATATSNGEYVTSVAGQSVVVFVFSR
ncbi:MAG: alpha-amylase family glycosyl hydrolase [Gemmatimonadaceae bacterium]